MHRCVPESEIHSIWIFYHSYIYGVHFRGSRTVVEVLRSGLFLPTLFRDAHHLCLAGEHFQCTDALSYCDMMPLSLILIVEIFDMWGIDFMGSIPPIFWLCLHIIAIDYVSKWVGAQAIRPNNHKV